MPDVLGTTTESGATRLGKRLWRKHLLPLGSWIRPGSDKERFEVTPETLKVMVDNFNAGILDHVPVPSHHTDDWEANRGEVVGLEIHPEKGLYATISVEDEKTNAALESKTLKGISAWFSENYLDKKTGKRVGPVLRHAALTNVPYIKHMGPYEAVLSEAGLLGDDDVLVALSEYAPPQSQKEDDDLTLDEIKALLRSDHDIDVDALTSKAARVDAFEQGIKSLREAGISLSEDASPEALVTAVTELNQKASAATETETALSERVKSLEETLENDRAQARKEAAARTVAPYKAAGKIAAAEEEKFLSLAETSPEMAKLVLSKLSDNVLLSEYGTTEASSDPALSEEDDDKEVARLRSLAGESGVRVRKGDQ